MGIESVNKKNDKSYPRCQSWQAQWREAPELEMTHYSSSYLLQQAQLTLSPCLENTDGWGLCSSNTRTAFQREDAPLCSCIVPGCSPSQDLPGHSQAAARLGFAAKAPAHTGAGGFVQGSGEAEFIYTPLSTCFLTSAAPL